MQGIYTQDLSANGIILDLLQIRFPAALGINLVAINLRYPPEVLRENVLVDRASQMP
jgi:hypothetical protein